MLPLSIIFTSILGCLESEDTGEPKQPSAEPTTEPSTEPASPASEPTTEPSAPTTEPASPASEPTTEPSSEIFEQDCSMVEGWCNYYSTTYSVSSSEYTAQLDASGSLTSTGCFSLCTQANLAVNSYGAECYSSCEDLGINADGTYGLQCGYYNECVVEGRGSACVEKETSAQGSNIIGAWFARAAHAEHASVFAFAQLHRELSNLGASHELLSKIADAIREEASHTKMMKDFAKANKGNLKEIQEHPIGSRSIWEIAVENLLEGCINESYAALQALYQSRHAQTDQLKGLFLTIAQDECKHAEIAREVHIFLCTLLTAEEQIKLQVLAKKQWKQLQETLLVQPQLKDLKVIGLPSPSTAFKMAQALEKAA